MVRLTPGVYWASSQGPEVSTGFTKYFELPVTAAWSRIAELPTVARLERKTGDGFAKWICTVVAFTTVTDFMSDISDLSAAPVAMRCE